MEQFSREYSSISHLSKDSEILSIQTKPKLVESLMIALTALQPVDSFMTTHSDTILKSMHTIMMQTELTAILIENNKTVNLFKASVTLKL